MNKDVYQSGEKKFLFVHKILYYLFIVASIVFSLYNLIAYIEHANDYSLYLFWSCMAVFAFASYQDAVFNFMHNMKRMHKVAYR